MNAEPQLYPPEAVGDEEPRYLRRQKPLEIRRRKFGRRAWPRYRRWMLLGAGVLAGGLLVVESARFLLFSPQVTLAGYDQIEIPGSRYVSRSAVDDVFAADLGNSILRVPLDARRAALEKIPWVEQASVERLLPDHLRVELTERTPVAFLRSGFRLALVDAAGVILDRPPGGDFSFPVVSGMDESMPQADRAARMHLFVKFMRAIALARADADDRVSEVNLSDAQDVRATLAGLPGLAAREPLVVHFGNTDFANKYSLLADNLGQWQAAAGRLRSVDLRFSGQVVVNPEIETARVAPSSKRAAGAR
jgi:cell division protein FtsQ